MTPELGNFDVIMQNKQFIAAKNNEKKSSVAVEIIWTINWDTLTLGVSRFANSELEIFFFSFWGIFETQNDSSVILEKWCLIPTRHLQPRPE